jgi:hypothetical protein
MTGEVPAPPGVRSVDTWRLCHVRPRFVFLAVQPGLEDTGADTHPGAS